MYTRAVSLCECGGGWPIFTLRNNRIRKHRRQNIILLGRPEWKWEYEMRERDASVHVLAGRVDVYLFDGESKSMLFPSCAFGEAADVGGGLLT